MAVVGGSDGEKMETIVLEYVYVLVFCHFVCLGSYFPGQNACSFINLRIGIF